MKLQGLHFGITRDYRYYMGLHGITWDYILVLHGITLGITWDYTHWDYRDYMGLHLGLQGITRDYIWDYMGLHLGLHGITLGITHRITIGITAF